LSTPVAADTALPPSRGASEATVVVLGNPNAGKSTIFNGLTGLSQKVGNYPGVTVEKKIGFLDGDAPRVRLIDLPGTYSLAARSPDEMVAVDVLLGERDGEGRPDLVLHVADASNLLRNLYLLSQILDLGVPILLVLNMTDVAERRGLRLDVEKLSRRLGVRVVTTQAQRGVGLPELEASILDAVRTRDLALGAAEEAGAADGTPRQTLQCLPAEIRSAVEALCAELAPLLLPGRTPVHPFVALRALVDEGGFAESRLLDVHGPGASQLLETTRKGLGGAEGLAATEAQARYAWLEERLEECIVSKARRERRRSERVDRILAHSPVGLLVFAAVMIVLFQTIFTWAQPLMEVVDLAFAWVGAWVGTLLPAGTLRSLVIDGVIAGVGGVLIFLPQILLLFLFVGVLEDCGYMARAAFLMDRVMARCGLSGKSFIPMLSGFACAVPGIMAARVVEDRRDRIATILVTPLMSCSARLPIYTILIGTFIPNTPVVGSWVGLQGLTLFSLYLLGMVTAVVVALLLKKTLLRGGRAPFLLELPSYKVPSLSSVLLRLYDRGKTFLVRAGTIILAMSILVWALAYFPRSAEVAASFDGQREAVRAELAALPASATEERLLVEARLDVIEQAEAGAFLRDSYFGRVGRAVEPLFRPLGWDWKISMAAIASFPAREVVVSTLGTIYNLGGEMGDEPQHLGDRLRAENYPPGHRFAGAPIYTPAVALSLMVFFALCCQCAATIATIKRETNRWGWAWFTFVYMTLLAYGAAFVTFQVGSRILWT